MRNFFSRIRNGIARFMYGRYGMDDLGKLLTILAWPFLILGYILSFFAAYAAQIISIILFIAALGCIGYSMFRMMSKNCSARYAENQKYLAKKNRVKAYFARFRDKEHKYYRCPKCKTTTRVPKGKGKIRIRCPKCGESFIRMT